MKGIFLTWLSISLIQFAYAQNNQANKTLTIEDIWSNYRFNPKGIDEIHSLNDGKSYTTLNPKGLGADLVRYSYINGKVLDTLIYAKDLAGMPFSNYSFDQSESKVLIDNDIEPIYRNSKRGNFSILDLHTHLIRALSKNGKQQEASFSPDGTKVAYVRENNLFTVDLTTWEEIQVTFDGKKNSVINGITDWVYEEEFEFAKAFFWSPDSKKIAFYRFDESLVPEYSIPFYKDLYPSLYTYKYPKAGEKNSVVTIKIYEIASKNTSSVNIGEGKDQYIPRIKWTQDPNRLCVYRLNRHQNHLEYLLSDASTGETSLLLDLKDPKYIDISKNDDLTFLPGNKEFLISDDRSGYLHYYRYSMKGKLINKITEGNWEVSKFYGYSEKSNRIYFQASKEDPTRREIYSINLEGKGLKKISNQTGWNEADFSKDYSYLIENFSNINSPPKFTVLTDQGNTLRVLEENKVLKESIHDFNFQPYTFLTVNAGNQKLNAWMIKPQNFDPQKKYPVLMFVYGGPGIQTVEDNFDGFDRAWYQILAGKGYIVVSVDGRGTGQRGVEFQKITYLNLGKYEVEDQIESAKWLAKQSYVDASRIGIWGWSFGGYLSSLCITKGNEVFKMAIAVAPVTNWRYYDTIYTERYMTSPQENPTGYDNNSPVNFADRLKGNFLMVHGTADDNVHFQNSIMFSEALIQLNKKFTQAYYPNRNHEIYGGNTRNHLYHRLTDFILENL